MSLTDTIAFCSILCVLGTILVAHLGWVNSPTFSATGRYLKLWESSCTNEDDHLVCECNFKYSQIGYNLNLEAQFENVDNYQYYTQLKIKTGSFSANGKSLAVYYWNDAITSWAFLCKPNANQVNTFNVMLTLPRYEIKSMGFQESNDNRQGSWQINYCVLFAP